MSRISGNIRTQTMSGYVLGGSFFDGSIGKNSRDYSIVTDKTLSLPERAADAKATGDRLSHVEEKIEHLETEVGDASLLLSLI